VNRRVGGVEAGGTKWICGVGTGPDDVEVVVIPTTTPAETIGRVVAFFREAGPVEAVGIGSFGPVDLGRGRITTTPKRGWADTDVAGPVASALGVPVAFETDVGAAAIGESRWGAAVGQATFCYVTVGTGIGGAAVIDGAVRHGAGHAEMGHQRVPHDRAVDPFAGVCPYHGDCWEGLACGPALAARWGRSATELADDHPAWRLEARYVAAGLANIALVLAPALVILAGGVGSRPALLELVRAELADQLGGYVPPPNVVPAVLGDRAGVLGALALARDLPAP
jgi:fructokinase